MVECMRNVACKPKSNADQIRSMTDEELAMYLPMVSDFICQPTEECIKILWLIVENAKRQKNVL